MSVCSPFGAWLLLAHAAATTSGEPIARTLKLSPGSARAAAAALTDPHPAVHAAAGAWARTAMLNTTGQQFLTELTANGFTAGPMPTQDAADAWTRQHTDNMIEQFPATISPATAMVLVSAVATDVSWTRAYDLAPAAELAGEFGTRVTQCLTGANAWLVNTRVAGLVGVHSAESTTGVQVFSVIAADATTVPADVHAAALEISAHHLPSMHPGFIPLANLPVTPTPTDPDTAWTITEHVGLNDTTSVRLPAWSARITNEDINAAPGVTELANASQAMLNNPDHSTVQQSTFAEYTRKGFRAAATTAAAFTARSMPATRPVRDLTIRFNRPYAVVAVTLAHAHTRQHGPREQIASDVWDRVPVFSAWVAAPIDASD